MGGLNTLPELKSCNKLCWNCVPRQGASDEGGCFRMQAKEKLVCVIFWHYQGVENIRSKVNNVWFQINMWIPCLAASTLLVRLQKKISPTFVLDLRRNWSILFQVARFWNKWRLILRFPRIIQEKHPLSRNFHIYLSNISITVRILSLIG